MVPFSKHDIRTLNKVLSKLTKEMCNISKSTTNILSHLSIEDFGINTISLLLDYMHKGGWEEII